MKISMNPAEILEFASSGKLPPEARKHLVGAFLEVIMSDEAIQGALGVVQKKAAESVEKEYQKLLRVEKHYNGRLVMQGYLAQDIERVVREALSPNTIRGIILDEIKLAVGKTLDDMVRAYVDHSVKGRIDEVVAGNINDRVTEKITDYYVDMAVDRSLAKKFGTK